VSLTEFLHIREAARRMGISQATLRRWEDEGLITVGRDSLGYRVYPAHRLDDIYFKCYGSGAPARKKLNESE